MKKVAFALFYFFVFSNAVVTKYVICANHLLWIYLASLFREMIMYSVYFSSEEKIFFFIVSKSEIKLMRISGNRYLYLLTIWSKQKQNMPLGRNIKHYEKMLNGTRIIYSDRKYYIYYLKTNKRIWLLNKQQILSFFFCSKSYLS